MERPHMYVHMHVQKQTRYVHILLGHPLPSKLDGCVDFGAKGGGRGLGGSHLD